MGIEDEKTRKVRAVKRRVTEVATRPVKAVQRRRAPEPFAELLAVRQVDVLARGALVNEAGEQTNGWVFREPGEKTGLLSFVARSEPLLTTLSRAFSRRADELDVMFAGERIAMLVVAPLPYRTDANARLVSVEGESLAGLHLSVHRKTVEATAQHGRPLLVMEQEHPLQHQLLAGRRRVGRLLSRTQAGVLIDTYDLELSFEAGASGLERLCASAMIVLREVWKLAPASERRRDRDLW